MSKKPPSSGDPYQPPSAREVHESGTADWVDKALEVHERKQQKLVSMLDQDREALRQQKESVQQMWSVSGKTAPPPPEEPRAPDLFARERAANEQKQARLSAVFEDDLQARAAEEDRLRDFFGGGGGKKKPRL